MKGYQPGWGVGERVVAAASSSAIKLSLTNTVDPPNKRSKFITGRLERHHRPQRPLIYMRRVDDYMLHLDKMSDIQAVNVNIWFMSYKNLLSEG